MASTGSKRKPECDEHEDQPKRSKNVTDVDKSDENVGVESNFSSDEVKGKSSGLMGEILKTKGVSLEQVEEQKAKRKEDLARQAPIEKQPHGKLKVMGAHDFFENKFDDIRARIPLSRQQREEQKNKKKEKLAAWKLQMGTSTPPPESANEANQQQIERKSSGDSETTKQPVAESEVERDSQTSSGDVHAMLEEGVANTQEDLEYHDAERIVLVERGADPLSTLPNGWKTFNHQCGMPLYFHHGTRVVTWARPYEVPLNVSIRQHKIPVNSVPCLHYRRAKEEETAQQLREAQTSDKDVEKSNENKVADVKQESNADISQAGGPTLNAGQSGDQSTLVSESAESLAGPTSSLMNDTAPNNSLVGRVGSIAVLNQEDLQKKSLMDGTELRKYCEQLFEFRTLHVKKFKTWADRRRYLDMEKVVTSLEKLKPSVDKNSKIVTYQIPNPKNPARTKTIVFNPDTESSTALLFKYTQHVFKHQPVFKFVADGVSSEAFRCDIWVDKICYGSGVGTNKKFAKNNAAKEALKVLIPALYKDESEPKTKPSIDDETMFDDMEITDPRIAEISKKLGRPSPVAVLQEFLKRHHGQYDDKIETEVKRLENTNSEFTMRLGSLSCTVEARNKRDGKQCAAQGIIKQILPSMQFWGSVLRLHERAAEMQTSKENKEKLQELGELVSRKTNDNKREVNMAVLEKLKEDMRKLYDAEKEKLCSEQRFDWDTRHINIFNSFKDNSEFERASSHSATSLSSSGKKS